MVALESAGRLEIGVTYFQRQRWLGINLDVTCLKHWTVLHKKSLEKLQGL